TGVEVGSTLLGGLGLLLHEFAGSFRHFQVLEVLEGVRHGGEGIFEGVEHGIGFGGHRVSPSSGFELWARPVRLARGDAYMTRLMVRRNINVAPRYHKIVIRGIFG